MSGFLTFVIILILGLLLWPTISRWIRQWVMRKLMDKAEDHLRSQMGMPPRDRKKAARQQNPGSGTRRPNYKTRRGVREPLIPPEYAVDVEYTEIKSYSSDTVIAPDPVSEHPAEVHYESQVSDAEWVEIKPRRS